MAHAPYSPGEVEPGVTLADLATVEDCERVLDRLQASIVSIEQQLGTARTDAIDATPGWRARANAALRAKKLMLPRLQERRADLKRQARRAEHQERGAATAPSTVARRRRLLLGIAWNTEPEAMRRVEALARERHPELFKAEGEAT